jgi:hypothetical protein
MYFKTLAIQSCPHNAGPGYDGCEKTSRKISETVGAAGRRRCASWSSNPSDSRFLLFARKCKYDTLYFGAGSRAIRTGGAGYHSNSFVSGSRSKWYAKTTEIQRLEDNDQIPRNASLVSGFNLLICALFPRLAPPAAARTDLSDFGGFELTERACRSMYSWRYFALLLGS